MARARRQFNSMMRPFHGAVPFEGNALGGPVIIQPGTEPLDSARLFFRLLRTDNAGHE